MTDSHVLEKIGRRLREASRDVIDEQLPEHWCVLIGRLAKLEQRNGCSAVHRSRVGAGKCHAGG